MSPKSIIFVSVFLISGISGLIDKELNLEDLRWQNRVIILFAPSPEEHTYVHQMAELNSGKEGLSERKLRIISVFYDGSPARIDDEKISSRSADSILERFSRDEQGFHLKLIGKDGGVKHTAETLVPNHELYRIIDRMPMRRNEIRNN
ncbi:MAG: DUF4174 domain-containing protein [Balneolales bacterium]|nr:DUF4174 domain-containing protein [Balneolales bacterium]